MGVETPRPILTDLCRRLNFTNEGGVAATTRVLKNIAGLWLVQECRRIWRQSGSDLDWNVLIQNAAAAPPLVSLINPDDPRFQAPRDMPQAIRDFLSETGQPLPASEGAMIRSILESLALRYRMVLGWLEQLTGGRIETVHIVGGGTQNQLLCQMAADATNRRVVAGPVEATAIGNIMLQAVAAGHVPSIAAARQIIRASFDVAEYLPREPQRWDDAFERFTKVCG
jgi:rhamnulokinase